MATKNPRTILWGVDDTGEMREVGVYDDGAGGYTLVAPSAVAATVDVSDRAARLLGKLSANSGVDIGDVDVASSALPTGASTEATLASIKDTDGIKKITDALPAGTNAIGKLAANSGVDIGDVDVLSLPALPAGTNAIGKLAANSGVDIGDVDVTSLPVAYNAGVAGATVQRTVEAVDSPLPLALGIPDQANMGVLAFDASSTVALTASSTYQIIATEDCHFHVTDGAEAATSSHMFLPAGQYYLLRTGSTIKNLYAIKSVTAGNLHYCKMLGNE